MTPIRFDSTRARWLALAPWLGMLLLAGQTQAHPLYDTSRLLTQQGNACVGAKSCRVIKDESKRIRPGRAQQIVARCPDERPWLVNWDATHHEHIGIRQIERRPRAVTVVASNQADASGKVTLFIGCAKNRPGPTPQLQAMNALPSKAVQGVRP
ncbi:MAG: hypothetical protein AB7I59_25320 [Geminicoccaceae bacterium]